MDSAVPAYAVLWPLSPPYRDVCLGSVFVWFWCLGIHLDVAQGNSSGLCLGIHLGIQNGSKMGVS